MLLVVLWAVENFCSDKGFEGKVVRVWGDLVLLPLQFWGVNNMHLGMVGGDSYTHSVRVHFWHMTDMGNQAFYLLSFHLVIGQ